MKHIPLLILLLTFTLIHSQKIEYEIFNTSINSKFAELGVTYLNNNSVLFASSKKSVTDKAFKKDRRKNNQQLYLELYKATIAPNRDLIQIGKFKNELKSMFFESDITFTSDFKTVYFTWNNFYNTKSKKDSAKWRTLRLVKASVTEDFNIYNITTLPFNSKKYSISNPKVSKDGKKLFFVSDMPNGYGGNDIYVVDILNDGNYSTPKNLGPNVNTSKSESFPFIDKNNTLYFSSYGHKGKGNLDIFKSNFEKGEYQKAINLPSPLNSKNDDFAFVINSEENSGYLTSNRKGSKGDVDIYAFKLKEKLKECTTVVTGIVINKETQQSINNAQIALYHNTILQETKIIIKDSKYSFKLKCNENYKIVAEKEGFIKEEIEIKTTNKTIEEFSKNIALTPIKCTQLITGTIFDVDTNKPLNNFQVVLSQENNLKNTKTIKIGNAFEFELDCEKTYTIQIQKEGYSSIETTLNTNNINKTTISKTFGLKPIACKQLFTGVILDTETNKPLSKALLKIYTNNNLADTITLDDKAAFSYELDCKASYKIVTSLKNYQNSILQISTSNKLNENIFKTLLLKPNVEFITVREQKMIKTNPIYFDLNQSVIRPDAAIELEKVISILYKYPTIKIEIKSHTDSRAPDDYNMNLSNKRALATMNYIISRGIDPSRVFGKGYGETQLVNKCSNGVKCTQAEHEMNRRTEFIIIEE